MFDQLSLNILDIGMNSLAAGATVLRITVIENAEQLKATGFDLAVPVEFEP